MFKKKYEDLLYNVFTDADINLFHSLFSLFILFDQAGQELYLVGGCVRDLLLHKKPKDYDLCTNLKPQEIKDLLGNVREEPDADCQYSFIDSGIKHGTITVHDRYGDFFYEITTYRIDGKYTDARHPDDVTFTSSLEEDLKRRDFTINSFAYNLLKKEVIALEESFFDDLDLGIIRTVSNATERFREDALRMLRAIRFSAQLNFSIAKETYEAIKLDCDWMLYVSRERVRDELTKILLSDNPQRLELFAITGLEKHSFDGYLRPIQSMLNCEHENPWHYADVFHHTMDVVKAVPKTFELRWAALLHDTGKPKVKKPRPQGPEGHYVYYDHPEVSCEIALQLMEVLKFSNDQKDLIYKYIKYHDDDLVECKKSTFKKVLVDIGTQHFADFIKLRFADACAHRLIKDTKYAIDYIDALKKRFNETVIQNEALTVKDLKVNGFDMLALGLKGVEIGETLQFLLQKVLDQPDLNTKENLLSLAKEYKHVV